MKKTLLLFLISIYGNAFSQAPQGMNYQAIVRDNLGNIVANQTIGIKFSIHQGSGLGPIVYSETQTPITDQFGSISVVIGQGTVVLGNFASINWSSGIYFNEVLLDVTGGTNYVSMGSSQLMSVPYALYANRAGALVSSPAQNFVVRINGVPITDSTLDIAMVDHYIFLSKTGYQFSITGYLSNAPDTSQITSAYFSTDDTIAQANVYVGVPPENDIRGNVYTVPNIWWGALSNHLGETWYIPMNATPVLVPVAFQPNRVMFQGDPNYITFTNQLFYQAFPNDPAVTGLNLPNPFLIQLSRN
jgi:hypothetical protein